MSLNHIHCPVIEVGMVFSHCALNLYTNWG